MHLLSKLSLWVVVTLDDRVPGTRDTPRVLCWSSGIIIILCSAQAGVVSVIHIHSKGALMRLLLLVSRISSWPASRKEQDIIMLAEEGFYLTPLLLLPESRGCSKQIFRRNRERFGGPPRGRRQRQPLLAESAFCSV